MGSTSDFSVFVYKCFKLLTFQRLENKKNGKTRFYRKNTKKTFSL